MSDTIRSFLPRGARGVCTGQRWLLGIEAVRGKPLSEKTENIIYTGGAVMVGALMIFAIFNDVSRFF